MSQAIKDLNPKSVWSYFYDLTQIPRPTGQVKEVCAYVERVGKELGLETLTDEVGNVLIRKPATPGMEDRKIVTLQSHLDMVPQKNSHVAHDFSKDPIQPWIDGDWVKAKETTLGADNGIGAAMALAVMADKSLVHGPLEALFTIDEEVGMVGAFGLKPGFSKGDILLNLDSEEEGELFIGCAGGVDINVSLGYKDEEPAPEGDVAVLLKLSGLKGGHSGVDIHLGRGNANKMMFRFLKKAVEELSVCIAWAEGGSLRNAIPREATALITVQKENASALWEMVSDFEDLYNKEYAGIEEGIKFVAEEHEMPKTIVPDVISNNVIHAIEACQNGVITYLSDFPGTVEASSSLAFVKLRDGALEVKFLTRSSSETRKYMVASSIESAFALIGAKVDFDAPYNGWQPNAHSYILEVMCDTYEKLYKVRPAVKVMHAGLECGIIQGVMPDMEMISFGPTIAHPHSPDEKVNIPTVAKTWDLLVAVLAAV